MSFRFFTRIVFFFFVVVVCSVFACYDFVVSPVRYRRRARRKRRTVVRKYRPGAASLVFVVVAAAHVDPQVAERRIRVAVASGRSGGGPVRLVAEAEPRDDGVPVDENRGRRHDRRAPSSVAIVVVRRRRRRRGGLAQERRVRRHVAQTGAQDADPVGRGGAAVVGPSPRRLRKPAAAVEQFQRR